MALQSLHEHFWPGDGVVNEVPVVNTGYVNAATIGCLYPALPRAPKWLRRLGLKIVRLVPERIWILFAVIRLLYSADYRMARQSVRQVAVMPGMRDKRVWADIGRRTAAVPGMAEDLYRRLLANEIAGRPLHRQRHRQNALIELAYFAYRERGI